MQQTEARPGLRPLDDTVLAIGPDGPRLIGGECAQCGSVSFPRARSCQRCASSDVAERRLGTRGTLWSWTVQAIRPKSPPYAGDDQDAFVPFGVGYVELPGELRVQSRLRIPSSGQLRIGMEMELYAEPFARADGEPAFTFGFAAVGEDE
jgi:uncharacterized OB-fold protein